MQPRGGGLNRTATDFEANVLRHCERGEFTPEAIQFDDKLVVPSTSQKILTPLDCHGQSPRSDGEPIVSPTSQITFTPRSDAKSVVTLTSQTSFIAIRHLRPSVEDPAFLNLSKISNKLDSRAMHENDIKIEFLLHQGARRRLGGVAC